MSNKLDKTELCCLFVASDARNRKGNIGNRPCGWMVVVVWVCLLPSVWSVITFLIHFQVYSIYIFIIPFICLSTGTSYIESTGQMTRSATHACFERWWASGDTVTKRMRIRVLSRDIYFGRKNNEIDYSVTDHSQCVCKVFRDCWLIKSSRMCGVILRDIA